LSSEQGEHVQWLCHDDTTVNIALSITSVTIRAAEIND